MRLNTVGTALLLLLLSSALSGTVTKAAHVESPTNFVASANKQWTTLMERGQSELAAGKYSQADISYSKALDVCRKLHLPEKELILSLNNLAIVCLQSSKYARAIGILKEAKSLSEKVYGANSVSVALCLDNLSAAYNRLGNLLLADSMREKALEIFERSLPASDPDVFTCMNNLAVTKANLGNYSQAQLLLKKAEALSSKKQQYRSLTARTWYNVACVLHGKGRLTEASDACGHAMAIAAVTPVDRESLGEATYELANIRNDEGRLDEAFSLVSKARDLLTRKDGTMNPIFPSVLRLQAILQTH